ncbi:MAG TPA: GspH/FimT family pseudopilin [Tepidisphaeraceae bacterium]|nr:GspH/FimT family pseudopilin [Tepidisphaeraceae bacterium]
MNIRSVHHHQLRTSHCDDRRAFTLIEMVLVMVVLAIGVSLTAPSLRGWSQGATLRDAGQQFLAATQLARSQAAATGVPHRLQVDTAANTYVLGALNGAEWLPVPGEFGQPTALPAEHRIEINTTGTEPNAIDFYPNGRTTPCSVRLIGRTGEAIEFACAFPAEPFQRVIATP